MIYRGVSARVARFPISSPSRWTGRQEYAFRGHSCHPLNRSIAAGSCEGQGCNGVIRGLRPQAARGAALTPSSAHLVAERLRSQWRDESCEYYLATLLLFRALCMVHASPWTVVMTRSGLPIPKALPERSPLLTVIHRFKCGCHWELAPCGPWLRSLCGIRT